MRMRSAPSGKQRKASKAVLGSDVVSVPVVGSNDVAAEGNGDVAAEGNGDVAAEGNGDVAAVGDDDIIIVLLVHNRPAYLNHTLDALSKVDGIQHVLLIVSHDGFYPPMHALVRSISFCRVKQLYFPFSPHLFNGTFPAAAADDCRGKSRRPWETKAGGAERWEQGGQTKAFNGHTLFIEEDHWLFPNALSQRTPHFPASQQLPAPPPAPPLLTPSPSLSPSLSPTLLLPRCPHTPSPHHWWWVQNTVWDGLPETRAFNGHMLFIVEDHWLFPNALSHLPASQHLTFPPFLPFPSPSLSLTSLNPSPAFLSSHLCPAQHHWWWVQNTVWDGLPETKAFNGHMLFIEEDHWLFPNALSHLRALLSAKRRGRCNECIAVSLAPADVGVVEDEEEGAVERRGMKAAGHAEREVEDWQRGEVGARGLRRSIRRSEGSVVEKRGVLRRKGHFTAERLGNVGYSFNRSVWELMHGLAEEFCFMDDYNWDRSMWELISHHMPSARMLRWHRASAWHFGEYGLHGDGGSVEEFRLAEQDKKDSIDKNAHLVILPVYSTPSRFDSLCWLRARLKIPCQQTLDLLLGSVSVTAMDPSTPVQDGVLTAGGGGSGGAAAAGGMPLISPSDVHVLVVDDERLSRLVVGNQFRRCGYQVTVADGGMEALRVLQERPDGFNLILVDLMMPGLDGLQLLRILRADSNYNAIPIIMMSGNSNQATVLQCIAAGAEEYLVKPVTKRDVTHMWQHVWRRIQLVSNAPESLQLPSSLTFPPLSRSPLAAHSVAGASPCPDGFFNPSAGTKPLLPPAE
ncbi:unnamed protein product [Closterium sp. Yama58-4]|nr:unnamed protein product [Closterium sp. Yama58-4]